MFCFIIKPFSILKITGSLSECFDSRRFFFQGRRGSWIISFTISIRFRTRVNLDRKSVDLLTLCHHESFRHRELPNYPERDAKFEVNFIHAQFFFSQYFFLQHKKINGQGQESFRAYALDITNRNKLSKFIYSRFHNLSS